MKIHCRASLPLSLQGYSFLKILIIYVREVKLKYFGQTSYITYNLYDEWYTLHVSRFKKYDMIMIKVCYDQYWSMWVILFL